MHLVISGVTFCGGVGSFSNKYWIGRYGKVFAVVQNKILEEGF